VTVTPPACGGSSSGDFKMTIKVHNHLGDAHREYPQECPAEEVP